MVPEKLTEQRLMLEGLQRTPTNKLVLLYSAGADSTAAGLRLLDRGFEIHPIFFDYRQTALSAEKHLALTSPRVLGFQDTRLVEVDLLSQLSKSALMGGDAKDDNSAWVPGRNTLFMLVAGIYGHQINADGIAIGYMLSDQGVFGDSNWLHHKMVETLLAQTLSRPMDVHLPLAKMNKKDVLRHLSAKGFLPLTVSCWNAKTEGEEIVSCHQCANCMEREQMLKEMQHEELPDASSGNQPPAL